MWKLTRGLGSLGDEATRGLARLRLANLIHIHDFHRDEFSATLRRREKYLFCDDVIYSY